MSKPSQGAMNEAIAAAQRNAHLLPPMDAAARWEIIVDTARRIDAMTNPAETEKLAKKLLRGRFSDWITFPAGQEGSSS